MHCKKIPSETQEHICDDNALHSQYPASVSIFKAKATPVIRITKAITNNGTLGNIIPYLQKRQPLL